MSSRADVPSFVVRHLVYPAWLARHGDRRLARLRELERNQWLPPEKLRALQLGRLNGLLEHAHRHTDFYRRRLDEAGIGPGPLASVDELNALPPISKHDLQNHTGQMISDAHPKETLVKDASGGSTGEPTVFYKDSDRHNLRRADQLRHDRWTGWDIGRRWALLWGARQDVTMSPTLKERITERWVQRCVTLDAFELTEAKMHEFRSTLERFRPVMILGYANALHYFAAFLAERHPDHRIHPAGIVSSAERLSDGMRETIEAAFRCPVLDRYGSREAGLIASQCSLRTGLHVNADNVLVEILRDGRPAPPGERGEVVITDLWNFGMPLIRYRMGDLAAFSGKPCGCGRGLPLLESVAGRSSDFLTARDGTAIHGEFFTHLFYGIDSVRRFQVVQHSLDRVTLKVVPRERSQAPAVDEIVRKTQAVLGGGVDVEVEICESIPTPASGKHRFTISHVQPGHAPAQPKIAS